MVNKISVEKRREEIKELIAEEGIFRINKSALGRKYGVSDVMIGKDIEVILKEIPDEKIENIFLKIYAQLNHLLIINEKLLMSEDENIRLRAIQMMMVVINRYIDFIKYYVKEKDFFWYKMNNDI